VVEEVARLLPDPFGFYVLIVVWLGWIGLTGARLRRLP
jgi:hypothetical protein